LNSLFLQQYDICYFIKLISLSCWSNHNKQAASVDRCIMSFFLLSVHINVGDNNHTINVFSLFFTHIAFRSLILSSYSDVDPDADTPFVTFYQGRIFKDMSFFLHMTCIIIRCSLVRTITFLVNMVVYNKILTTKHVRISIVSNGIQMRCNFSAFLATIHENYLHCIDW